MENQNSVCYINRINKIEPIPGADNIELATVNGWNSIIKKGANKEGDLVLCVTTDAVIPEELSNEWGITNYLRKGIRVRTVKLRGVYSECILMPTSETEEGKDMMDVYKIYKYEEPETYIQLSSGRKVKQKDNPNFNKYYKFPNMKNTPNLFKEGDDIVITRKIHGTNARYGVVKKVKLSFLDKIKKFVYNNFNLGNDDWKLIDYEFVYGSHNVLKGSDTNGYYSNDVWKEIADKYEIKEYLWKMAREVYEVDPDLLGSGIIIYGEIYGAGIQGEKYSYGLSTHEIKFFDIELDKQYLSREEYENFTNWTGLSSVEVLYKGTLETGVIESFVLNQFIPGTKIPHEGVVVSCPSGDRHKIAKVINPDYLIYSEKNSVPENH